MKAPKIFVIGLIFLGLSVSLIGSLPGCAWLRPYKMDIQQGNVVTDEMISELKLGMTKTQIRYVLGTPVLHDFFHTNRWDYTYQHVPPNNKITTKRLTVFFKRGKVVKMTSNFSTNNKSIKPE